MQEQTLGTAEVRAKLREARTTQKLSLDEVARRVGCGRTTVWRVERDDGELPDAAPKVARALGLELVTEQRRVIEASYVLRALPPRRKARR